MSWWINRDRGALLSPNVARTRSQKVSRRPQYSFYSNRVLVRDTHFKHCLLVQSTTVGCSHIGSQENPSKALVAMAEGTTLSVHRCRFVDFSPSAVTALAFPPLPLPSVKGKKKASIKKKLKFGILAIGRANGNIELCEWTGHDHQNSAPQAWVVKKVSIKHVVCRDRLVK